jgi:hypothetical protein
MRVQFLRKAIAAAVLTASATGFFASSVQAQDVRFDISRFQIEIGRASCRERVS